MVISFTQINLSCMFKQEIKLQHGPYSVMINEKNTQFSEDLRNFDRIPTRVHNTAFVFYVANDNTTAAQVNCPLSK